MESQIWSHYIQSGIKHQLHQWISIPTISKSPASPGILMHLSLRAVNCFQVRSHDYKEKKHKYIQLGRYAVHVSDSWHGFQSCTQSLLRHSSRRKAEILNLEDKTCPFLGFVWNFDGYCYAFTSPNVRFDEYRFSGLPDKKPNPNLFSLSPRKLTRKDYYLLDRMASTIIAALEQFFLRAYLERKNSSP